jgi:hypothetical protein
MARNGRPTSAPWRQLTGQDRSRQPIAGAAEDDPERHLATANYRTAKCYSITSSARVSTDAGTSTPSAFAALRLMTKTYLFGACRQVGRRWEAALAELAQQVTG